MAQSPWNGGDSPSPGLPVLDDDGSTGLRPPGLVGLSVAGSWVGIKGLGWGEAGLKRTRKGPGTLTPSRGFQRSGKILTRARAGSTSAGL